MLREKPGEEDQETTIMNPWLSWILKDSNGKKKIGWGTQFLGVCWFMMYNNCVSMILITSYDYIWMEL